MLYSKEKVFRPLHCAAMVSSSSDVNNLEIRRFEGTGFDLEERMQGILFLKDCDKALEAEKPGHVTRCMADFEQKGCHIY